MNYLKFNQKLDEYLDSHKYSFYLYTLKSNIEFLKEAKKRLDPFKIIDSNKLCLECNQFVDGMETLDLVSEFLNSVDKRYTYYFERSLNDGSFGFCDSINDTNDFSNNAYISNNKNLYDILNSDYFYKDNLERYLKYDKDNIVLNVNMNLDYEFYTHDIEVTTKDSTMLVNKYYKLDKTYIPTLTTLDRAYAVNDKQQVTPETKEAFQEMCDDAKKDNIYIYSGSAYRSYSYQNTLFNNRAKMEGLDYANKTAAKAGYSEHQTGLSMDLMNKNYDYISAEDEEYEWLINNSYKYGFILRFPKDMDNITGYTYEPWHFRYINIEIATYLKENNLTYE